MDEIQAGPPRPEPTLIERGIYRVLDRFAAREFPPNDLTDHPVFARWKIGRLKDGRFVYLHHLYPSNDPWLHDHWRSMITIGLGGRYFEQTSYSQEDWVEWRAPWIRAFDRSFVHRFWVKEGESAWSLSISSNDPREWFWYPPVGPAVPYMDRKKGDGFD